MENLEHNNKRMPNQEIGLFRMAKEKKAMKEMKHILNKTAELASIVHVTQGMKAPMHSPRFTVKKKK